MIWSQPKRLMRRREFSGPRSFPSCGKPTHQDQSGDTWALPVHGLGPDLDGRRSVGLAVRGKGFGCGRGREWSFVLRIERL